MNSWRPFNRRDVGAVLALYEPDAIFTTAPGTVIAGLHAIEEAVKGLLALNGTITINTRHVYISGDLALLHGDWNLPGTGADGAPLEIAALDTEVARRQPDGTWLFVIDDPFGNTLTTP